MKYLQQGGGDIKVVAPTQQAVEQAKMAVKRKLEEMQKKAKKFKSSKNSKKKSKRSKKQKTKVRKNIKG